MLEASGLWGDVVRSSFFRVSMPSNMRTSFDATSPTVDELSADTFKIATVPLRIPASSPSASRLVH